MSAGVVFTLEYFDPSFRTPAEVEAFFNRPVLAAVPDQQGGLICPVVERIQCTFSDSETTS